ncbi:hypothetical protein ACTFIU_011202 [Dictyostelium citrinum]
MRLEVKERTTSTTPTLHKDFKVIDLVELFYQITKTVVKGYHFLAVEVKGGTSGFYSKDCPQATYSRESYRCDQQAYTDHSIIMSTVDPYFVNEMSDEDQD